MAISNKIIDTDIVQDESIQINYDKGDYLGIGDIANLYTIFDHSVLNENKINEYPGIVYGEGKLEFNYFGIRDLGYNGNTYNHEWHVFIVDSAMNPEIEDYVIPSNNSHGYTYSGGAGNNSSTFSDIDAFRSSRRIWRLDGPHGSSIGGSWSPCSSGLTSGPGIIGGGLVGWYDGVYRNSSCELTSHSSWNVHPSDSSIPTTWKFPDFPFTDNTDRNWYEPNLMDNIQQDLELFSQDLYSHCVDTNNDGIPDQCIGGSSDGDSCSTDDDCFEGAYYIIVYMQSDDAEYIDETRDDTITVYKLPKKHVLDLWLKHDGSTETITWKSGGTYSRPDRVESEHGKKGAAAFSGGDLSITLTAPQFETTDDLPPEDLSNWYNILDQSDYLGFSPINNIDYVGMKKVDGDPYTLTDIFDFRPISWVGVNYEDELIDIQSWYDLDSIENLVSSAPNQVNLSFRISDNSNNPNIDYYDYDFENNQWKDHMGNFIGDVDFSFFVIDWDADNDDISNEEQYWTDLISESPSTFGEMTAKQSLHNTYEYSDLIDFENGGYKSLSHGYQTSGVKIIKALIFSYIKHPSDGVDDVEGNLFSDYRQSLRWKIVSIRVFLGANASNIEDFSDLGGADFTYIPWPHTTPIIGGISDGSDYYNSVYDIFNANLFDDNELYDYYRTFTAFRNLPGNDIDELGNHLGDIDFSQARYFTNGSYDMNTLLNLSNEDLNPDSNTLNSYDDFDYWQGDQCVQFNTCGDDYIPTYPLNSCVGMIFINDNEMKHLRDNCLIELNASEEEDNLIDDTSGNDHRGILLGDYSVKKDDYNKPVSRDKSIEVPDVDRNGGAF